MFAPNLFSGQVLFIGAHPDDIEIGAGGTVAKFVENKCDVWLCILSSEPNIELSEVRRSEAITAANALGLSGEKIIFAEFEDGKVVDNAKSVSKMRNIFKTHKIDPDIIFTHTSADSHNDHRSAYGLTIAVFRNKPILAYPVVNSHLTSKFHPSILIDIEETLKKKMRAIKLHKSQSNRLSETRIVEFCTLFSEQFGLSMAEPFELVVQAGAEKNLDIVLRLNDSPFNSFWYNLIRDEKLLVIHAHVVVRKNKNWDHPHGPDIEAINLIQQSFADMWRIHPAPLQHCSCDDPPLEGLLGKNHILLTGGAVSNSISLKYFNRFKGLRYVIDYTMPDYEEIYIVDRKQTKKIRSEYYTDKFDRILPKIDYGILTIMKNPFNKSKYLVGCMGIHRFGTLGCYEFLLKQRYLNELLDCVQHLLKNDGFQIIIEYNNIENKASLIPKSLHKIPSV